MEIIVIGGGAAGLTAAICARRKNNKVTILEKNSQVGKKLRMTGNGKCNYYNIDQRMIHYHSENKSLIKKVITQKNLEKVSSFFTSIGIVPVVKEGYYYPYSKQAISVVIALVTEAEKIGVNIVLDTKVEKIEKKGRFMIKTNQGNFIADQVIMATGGMSYQKTGSDGWGYSQLEKLGHSVTKPLPCLTSLMIQTPHKKEWKGIRTEVSLKLFENEKLIREEKGELQLTEEGISGICAMQLSSYISKGLDLGKREQVEINFIPFLSKRKDFISLMDQRDKKLKNRTLIQLLEGILNYKLVQSLLKEKQNLIWSDLSMLEKEKIGEIFLSYKVTIKDTNSFDHAQTTLGGVLLTEVNLETMESLKIEGLYIIGELLDVSGDCGGYNLTLAWISGICAGESLC